MKPMNTYKRTLSLLLVLTLSLALLAAPALAAELPDSLYLVQSRRGTCTLASAAMMVRSALYLGGSDNWENATEQDVQNVAWNSAGLVWSWTYVTGDDWVSVEHASVSGMTLEELEDLLYYHPEGIVLYCGNLPHAVFVTESWYGEIWCADPIYGYLSTLADSYLGSYGGQDSILANVTAYWVVADWSIG